MTARPLADWTLPPAAAASINTKPAASAESNRPIEATSAPQLASPIASARRSPIRSVTKPHGKSESVSPTHSAAMKRPTPCSPRSYSSRSAGAIAGKPRVIVEKLACAAVPAASTAQR